MVEPLELSSDLFLEYALREEQMAPVSPIRRRQESDPALPRGKTNRELTDEIQRLKDSLMTANMRVELLKKDNSKLQHDLTIAKEEFEPLEIDNDRLRFENENLVSQMKDMQKGMVRLQKEVIEQRESNKELIAINEECSAHWNNQEAAVKEAAEIITKLQEDKAALKNELLDLHSRVTALEKSSVPGGHMDGPARGPSRVKSIDDMRPSTSNFGDSDYYSQAESPPQRSNGSIYSFNASDRSDRFYELSKLNRRSAQNLQKRMSALTMKASVHLEESPIPDIPQIPLTYQREMREEEAFRHISKSQRSKRSSRILLDAPPLSPPLRPATTAPMSSMMSRHDELRGLYHPDRTGGSRIVNDSRPTSSHGSSAFASRTRSRQGSVAEGISPRLSNHRAQTSISGERLTLRHAPHLSRPQSEYDVHTVNYARAEPFPAEWAAKASPRSMSNTSDGLTTVADPQGWLKDIQRLTEAQRQEQAQSQAQSEMQAASLHIKFDEESNFSVRKNMTAPSTSSAEDKNSLSSRKEDEESFLSRMKSKIGSSSKRARSRSRDLVRK